MKKHILAGLLLFIAMAVSAQKKITASELPKDATAFLDKHFKGNAIDHVKKDSEHGEKGYEVILADGTEVEFWKDGKYREVDGNDKPIPTDFIPASIVDYVKKNYPNEKITHIDYGHKDIDVDLTHDIDLEFGKDGKFLKKD